MTRFCQNDVRQRAPVAQHYSERGHVIVRADASLAAFTGVDGEDLDRLFGDQA